MSLISDALKTAQRERSGQASRPSVDQQPLLEGFFPYVATSAPDSRGKRTRVAVLSVVGVAVFIIAAWFGLPAIKRAMSSTSTKPLTVPAPRAQVVSAPPPPAPVAADTQAAAAVATDSTPAATKVAEQPRSGVTQTKKPAATEPKTAVAAAQPLTARRDSAVAQPSATLPSVPDRRGIDPGGPRRNFEAEAIAAFNAGDYPTARARFEEAVRATPTASVWTNYGVTLEKLGDSRAATRAYRSAMGIDPNYFNAWLYLARVYNMLGDVTTAVPLFNRALQIEPTNTDVNADLAELEYKAGAFSEARRYAEVATRSNPTNSRAQYFLALSADTLKDREVARKAFEDYLRAMVGQEKDNLPSIGYARARIQVLKDRP